MNKKTMEEGRKKMYVHPQMKVIKIDSCDIICTSGDNAPIRLGSQGYEEEDW